MSGRRVSSSVAVRLTQPLEPVSHRRSDAPRARRRRPPPGTARDRRPRGGPSTATCSSWRAKQRERVGRVDGRRGRGGRRCRPRARSCGAGGPPGRRRRARHRDQHPLTRREPERGRGVMRQAVVARPLVGERDAQARDRHAAERARGVEDRADLHAAEPEAGVGADDARAHRDDRGVGVRRRGGRPRAPSRSTPPRSRRRTRGRT